MKNSLLIGLLAAVSAYSQNVVGWSATTGDVALVGAGTVATVQKTATNTVIVNIDQVIVYCSVACDVTMAANGSAATATAGTIRPLLPATPTGSLPFNFYTASNVGAGTAQGGITHIPAGQTVVLCLNTRCGASQDAYLGSVPQGSGTNLSVTISSITGTANITFIGRVSS